MSYAEDMVTLRREIDRIDVEIVEKIAEWAHAYNGTRGINSETFIAQLQGLALEHDLKVGGLNRVFHAMKTLAEKGRVR